MPRVRYGPDITDDADSLMLDASRIKNQLRGATGKKRARLLKEQDLLNKAIKEVFGNRENARKLAKESTRQQGYMSPAEVRALGVKRNKKIKGKGQLGLAATPGRGSQQIGRKKGYQARAKETNEALYKLATQRAKSSAVLKQVRRQKTAAEANRKASKSKAAKKATAVKKATPVKKAAAKKPAVKKVAAKKAPAKKAPAKKAPPRKKR
jgi:hypothetical protein